MSTNATLNTNKEKINLLNSQLIENNAGGKATSLRPNRSVTPSRSLYRTGIKTVITNIKNDEIKKEES